MPRLSVSARRPSAAGASLPGILGCFGLFGCAFTIILLSGTAGWTGGKRLAEMTARARQQQFVHENCALFAEDIAEKRTVFLQRRIELLASQTPTPACLAFIPATATALADALRATATPTTSATATAAPPTRTAPPPTPTTVIIDDALVALAEQLEEARRAIGERQWQRALETLEAIRSADADFAAPTVNALLLNALSERARYYFNAGELARAILLVNRADALGLPQDDELRFRRLVAIHYLDALRWKNVNPQQAIDSLNEVIRLTGGNYTPTGQQSAHALLAESHAASGAMLRQSDPCAAVQQYENAIRYGSRIDADLAAARAACENELPASPTPS